MASLSRTSSSGSKHEEEGSSFLVREEDEETKRLKKWAQMGTREGPGRALQKGNLSAAIEQAKKDGTADVTYNSDSDGEQQEPEDGESLGRGAVPVESSLVSWFMSGRKTASSEAKQPGDSRVSSTASPAPAHAEGERRKKKSSYTSGSSSRRRALHHVSTPSMVSSMRAGTAPVSTDMGEAGHLHLKVMGFTKLKSKAQLEAEIAEGGKAQPDFPKRVFCTVEMVQADYSRAKSIFPQGDVTHQQSWGEGLHFRIFGPHKEAQIELKIFSTDAEDQAVELGTVRLVIVPAIDFQEPGQWNVVKDRFGRITDMRMKLLWSYTTKLNKVSYSIKSTASDDGSTSSKLSDKLVFNGSLDHSVLERRMHPNFDSMIDGLCNEFTHNLARSEADFLCMARYFAAFRRIVEGKHTTRYLALKPHRPWWVEYPTDDKTNPKTPKAAEKAPALPVKKPIPKAASAETVRKLSSDATDKTLLQSAASSQQGSELESADLTSETDSSADSRESSRRPSSVGIARSAVPEEEDIMPLPNVPPKDRDVPAARKAFMKDGAFSGSVKMKKSDRTVQFFSRESSIVNMNVNKSVIKAPENKIKITHEEGFGSLALPIQSPRLLNFSARSKPMYDAVATKIQRVYRGHFGRINYFFRNVGKLADEFHVKCVDLQNELAESEARMTRAKQDLQDKERHVETVRVEAANGSQSDSPQVRAYNEALLALMSAHESAQAARKQEAESHAQLDDALRAEEEASERVKEVEQEMLELREGNIEFDGTRDAAQERLQAKLRILERGSLQDVEVAKRRRSLASQSGSLSEQMWSRDRFDSAVEMADFVANGMDEAEGADKINASISHIHTAAKQMFARKSAAVMSARDTVDSARKAREMCEMKLLRMSQNELIFRQRLDSSGIVHPSKEAYVDCASALSAAVTAEDECKRLREQIHDHKEMEEGARHTCVEGMKLWNDVNDKVQARREYETALIKGVIENVVEELVTQIEDNDQHPSALQLRGSQHFEVPRGHSPLSSSFQRASSMMSRTLSVSVRSDAEELEIIDDDIYFTDQIEVALSDVANTKDTPAYLLPIYNEMQKYMENSLFVLEAGRSLYIDDKVAARLYAMQISFLFLNEMVSKQVGICRALNGVSPEEIVRMLDFCKLVCVEEGHPVYEQNSEGSTFGIVMSGYLRVFYNRRPVSTLIRGQVFCDVGLIQQHPDTQVRGATYMAAVRTFVLDLSYIKFLEYVRGLGLKYELQLKSHLSQSDSIGRENWSQYGNVTKAIEISFMEFMCRKVGILGLFTMLEIRQLSSLAVHTTLKPGEMLCREGQVADSVYIIINGAANVFIAGKRVAVVLRGQEMGEMGLIGQFAAVRTATVQAHTDMDVAVIPYHVFVSFVADLPPAQSERVALFVAHMALPKYLHLQKLSAELGRKLVGTEEAEDGFDDDIDMQNLSSRSRNAKKRNSKISMRRTSSTSGVSSRASPTSMAASGAMSPPRDDMVGKMLALIRSNETHGTSLSLPKTSPAPPRFSPEQRQQMREEISDRAARNVRRRLMTERNPSTNFRICTENPIDRRYTPDSLAAKLSRPPSAAVSRSRPVSAAVRTKQQQQQQQQQHKPTPPSEALWGKEGPHLVHELRERVGLIRRAFQGTQQDRDSRAEGEEACERRPDEELVGESGHAVSQARSTSESAWRAAESVGVTKEAAFEKANQHIRHVMTGDGDFSAAAAVAVKVVGAIVGSVADKISRAASEVTVGQASAGDIDDDRGYSSIARAIVLDCVDAAARSFAASSNVGKRLGAQKPTPRPAGAIGWVNSERDNELDRSQFVSRLRRACSLPEAALDKLFDALDSSMSGHVTFADLRLFLSNEGNAVVDVVRSHSSSQRSSPSKSRPSTAGLKRHMHASSHPVPRLNIPKASPAPAASTHRPHSAVLRPFNSQTSASRPRPKTARPNLPSARPAPSRMPHRPSSAAPSPMRTHSSSSTVARGPIDNAHRTNTPDVPRLALPAAKDPSFSYASSGGRSARPSTARQSSPMPSKTEISNIHAKPPMPKRPHTARPLRLRPSHASAAAREHAGLEKAVKEARAHYLAREYSEARSRLDEALTSQEGRGYAPALITQAQVLNDGFCDMEAAEELLSTALTITPSDATALKMLGNIAWQSRGDAERAHQLLKRASDADPLDASIWCDLAEVTDSGLDNELAAVGLYARALSVDPQHCVARAETRRLVLTLRQRMAEGGEVAKIAGLVADAERTLLSSQGAQVDVHEGWVDEEADADQEADGGDSVEEFDEQIKALAEEAAKVLKAMQGKAPIQAGA